MINAHPVSVRLAGALLLGNQSISIGEIEALPFVNGRDDAYAIAQQLIGIFGPSHGVVVASDPWEADLRFKLDASIEGELLQ